MERIDLLSCIQFVTQLIRPPLISELRPSVSLCSRKLIDTKDIFVEALSDVNKSDEAYRGDGGVRSWGSTKRT